MQKKTKIKISLFSGGSGNDRFINLIKNILGRVRCPAESMTG